MTSTPALVHVLVAASSSSKSSSSSGLLTLLPLLAIGVLGYFFFIRPQQRKAQAARKAQGSDIEVGDEVQTVGGVIGTVLEIHGDRYTLLTGALGDDGNLDGPQPTRIVFVRQAIARKVERVEADPVKDLAEDTTTRDVRPSTNGSGDSRAKDGAVTTGSDDIDDIGGDSTTSGKDRGGESEDP